MTAVESLEPRRLRAAFSPTPYEQYAVELINRARSDPAAEAQRDAGFPDGQGDTYDGDLNEGVPADQTISADAKQPLAISPQLTLAARGHSAWMVQSNTFDHNETDPSATPYQRMIAAGYNFNGGHDWGENIAINWSSATLDPTETTADQQESLFTDQLVSDRGHRTNMMEASRNEIGVGYAGGPWVYPGHGTLNALAATHDTASNNRVFLTGVAYTDALTHDDFYTPGEGLGGITVTARRQSDGLVFSTATWASGGYSLELPAGTYDISGSGAGLDTTVYYHNVAVADQNVKEDFVTGNSGDGPATGDTFVQVKGDALVITGTAANDVIGVFVDDATGEYVSGLNGDVVRTPDIGINAVAVLAGDGNDRVVIGVGVLKSYVEGGAGKDTLIGGGGADTLYGNGGIDRIEGNGGNDLLVGENGNDLIYGGLGNDRIYGGVGNDTIDAGGGNDRVFGGPGDDLIAGGKGHDYLYGESGADTLNGGPHSDYGDDDPADTRIDIEVLT